MERSLKTISNVHIDHSIIMESINRLDGDALQNFQGAIMRYVNYFYGNFIEEKLRMDPQFRHLFGEKGKPLSSGIKEQDYGFQKREPKCTIANTTESKKLLDKVDSKSIIIKKPSKTLFRNVAHVKDLSGNNLGTFFLKKNPKLSKCIDNENQKVYKKLSLTVPDQNNNIECDEKTTSNQRIVFISNKQQIENPIIASNNFLDKDMHFWNLNDNIQQNEIYFSNTDCNEKKYDKNLSSSFCNVEDIEKGQKNMMICKNIKKVGTENDRNLFEANPKKTINSQTAFKREKYLRTEDLKKIERYKYNSGGHLKFCKSSSKKKCIYNLEGKEKIKSVQNIQFINKKDIPLKLCKLDLKHDSMSILSEKSMDSQTKMAVGSTLNNFSLEEEVSSKTDCNTNGISEVGKVHISRNIEEDNNVERSVNIVETSKIVISNIINSINSENEDIQKSKPYRKHIIVDSLKVINYMDGIHISNSTSNLQRIEFPPQKNGIGNFTGSGKRIEAISKEQYLEKKVDIGRQGLEQVTVYKEQNVFDEYNHCNLNFSEISSGNLTKQIETEHIREKNIKKSVNRVVDVSSEAIIMKSKNCNIEDSNHVNSKNFSNFHDNKLSNWKGIVSQGSNESCSNSSETSSKKIENHNLYVCPMKKYSSEPYAIEPNLQLKEKLETSEYSSLGVVDEETNDIGSITVNRKDCNELKINCGLKQGIRRNTNLELNNEQFENIQQNVNSVTYKIEEASSFQLKKETITHLQQPETKNSPVSLKNTLKTNLVHKIPLNEISLRRSSLRNKTDTTLKKDVENHMLVKITYDKENVRKNNILCKEKTMLNVKVNGRCSRNGDIKKNIDNGQTKTNFCYNLRSSITKKIHRNINGKEEK